MRLLLFAVLLSSCSANYHLKQACKKQPKICQTDTLVLTDTLVRFDSVVVERTFTMREVDTIRIDTGRVRIILQRSGNRFKANVSAPIDTIWVTRERTVTRQRWVTLTKWDWTIAIIGAFGVMVLGLLVRRR
jgi:hypothetical protein